jgi:hypothetical protein
MSYFSVARRSFQAGGQRGSLYLIAVSIKGLTDLFKNIFPEVAPVPPCWIVVEGSKLWRLNLEWEESRKNPPTLKFPARSLGISSPPT